MSERIAASEGGVSNPSGHHPWSSGPQWKIGAPLRVKRRWPLASRALPYSRSATYDATSSMALPWAPSNSTLRS